jgi:RNA polymerase sigma-70 factor (ECF subfamily)
VSTALQTEDLAFESLYRLHRPPVYAYALATMRHSADAEDVTQTTFLNAYCALHRGVAPRDDLQWLLAIARNVCRDRFREAKRRPKEEPLNDWTVLTQREQPEFTVSEICKEISELSPRYRQILLLREFEGRSYAEISAKLGVTEPAVQTLLTRARRALRDELELGMTCSQARRVSLRHLNGVALRDERRALQRHLRRCADCATFVGRTPRTPVARMLWLVWVPYRRIMTIIAGTSAPASPAAGGAGAMAAKLLTIAVVGGAAAGVTVREVTDAPTVGHVKRQPAGPVSLPPSRHATKPLASTAVTTTWATHNVASGREALTPTSHRATHRLPQLSSSTDLPTLAPTTRVAPHAVSVTPAESTPPTTPAATEADASHPPAPPQESPAPAGSGATVVDATPASSTGGTPGADSSGTPPVDATSAATGATPPTAAANATVPDGTPSTNVPPVAPGTTPPSTTPPTARGNGNGNGNANDNGNGIAVGQNGTPPDQANKPDAPAHGRP